MDVQTRHDITKTVEDRGQVTIYATLISTTTDDLE